jgi:TonB family protein
MPPPLRAIAVTRHMTDITFVTESSVTKIETKMLELKPKPTASAAKNGEPAARRQSGRLLMAFALLLVALVAVVVRDRQFWFGDDEIVDSDATVETVPATAKPAAPATFVHPAKSAPATIAKKAATAAKTPATPVQTAVQPSANDDGASITATRTALPPLDAEVVAGDSHRIVHPGTNATKVEITKPGSESAFAARTNAAERERIANAAGSYEATYPLLAQRMNVEGSVILEALIGTDGIIQNLHVLSGPAILAPAAQQAVKEWKFKPVIQNGQAIETKAKITVNFAIKVADGTKDQIASAQPLRYSYTAGGASR